MIRRQVSSNRVSSALSMVERLAEMWKTFISLAFDLVDSDVYLALCGKALMLRHCAEGDRFECNGRNDTCSNNQCWLWNEGPSSDKLRSIVSYKYRELNV